MAANKKKRSRAAAAESSSSSSTSLVSNASASLDPDEPSDDESELRVYGFVQMSDLTVRFQGTWFKVHKVMLAHHSKYFETFIEGNPNAQWLDLPADAPLGDNPLQTLDLFFRCVYGETNS